jgi:hypothetical protein
VVKAKRVRDLARFPMAGSQQRIDVLSQRVLGPSSGARWLRVRRRRARSLIND